MEHAKIEYLLRLRPILPEDSYRETIVAILTPPRWYRPLARYQFYRTLDTRVGLVMAEYAKDLLEAFYGTKTNTVSDDSRPTQTKEAETTA